jgi:glycosyltransferase involved in cell wall biosynthesis
MATPPTPVAKTAMPLRVVYFNYEWDLRESSGAATHIAELGNGLRALGHHVTGVSRRGIPAPATGTKAVARAASTGWRARLSPYLHESAAIQRAFRGISAEEAILRRERPDVVLTRYSLHQFSSLVAARRLGIPLVFELNAPVGYEYRKYLHHYRLVPGLAEWSEIRTLGAADGMFVVSNPLRTHLIDRGLPPDHIAVVPNGADAERFRPEVVDRDMRARFGDRVVVGFVGSFASFHGVDTLRRLITSVAPTRPDVAFLMVGGGKLADELSRECQALGLEDRVHFTGYVPRDRVPELLGAMDVVLAPYQPHDFFYFSPIKLFEYMASGRAVVAASLGQIAEVIDGTNGLLYDPNDPDALSRQVVRLAEDAELRRALGHAARRAVEASYTWAHNAARVSAALERAVAARRTPATSRRKGA